MIRRAGALLGAAVLLGVAQPAAAFELLRVSGNPCDNGSRNLSWSSHDSVVDLRFLPGDAVGVASEARARWNASVPRFRFLAGAGERCDLNDGVVTLGFGTTACNGRSLAGILGITVSRWRADGELLDAEITFNSNSSALSNQAVLFEVMLHELGHVLGLDHSDACGASGAGTLMKSTLSLAAPRLDYPQADDVSGANFIYGDDGSDGSVPEGANSCAVAAPGPHRWPGAPFLCLPLLIGLRRLVWGKTRGPRRRKSAAAVIRC